MDLSESCQLFESGEIELPLGWARAALGEVTAERVPQVGPPETGTFSYIDISSVDNKAKRIREPKMIPVSQAPSRARQNVDSGDVLVSMTRPNLNAVAIVPESLAGGVCSTGFHVLRAHGVEPGWLFAAVQTPEFVTAMSGLVQGALYPAVRPREIQRFEIPIPPLAEQRRIVAEIETQFTRLDAAAAALERARANLKRYRAAILACATSGHLVPIEADLSRREGRTYESADQLLARVSARVRSASESNGSGAGALADNTQLPQLPEGWAWSRVGEIFGVYVGATPSRGRADYWGGGIPWISSGEVAFCRIRETRETITPEGLKNSSTDLHPPGTVLLGMIGEGKTRGQVAILDIDACNNQNSAAIRVSEGGLSPEYVYRYLEGQYQRTRQLGSGNNQPALNKSRVQAMLIPVPPLAEQVRIVAEVEHRLSIAESLEGAVGADLRRAERLRQSILRKAFAGQLVPQGPNDEPASFLLERIRTERASTISAQRTRGRRLHAPQPQLL